MPNATATPAKSEPELLSEELPKTVRNAATTSELEEWLAAVVSKKPAGYVRYPKPVSPTTVGDINADKKRSAKSTDLVAFGRNMTAAGEAVEEGKTWLFVIGTWTPEGKEAQAKRQEALKNRKPRTPKAKAATNGAKKA